MQSARAAFPVPNIDPYKAAVAGGMVLMAVAPLRWLVATWTDPAYDSHGIWVFTLCVALAGWSVTSRRRCRDARDRRTACALLVFTALVRGAGQMLAVNVLGAMALVVDVYALGLLAGLNDRERALSPGWLALLFSFALPMERMLQRVAGYGLQQLSAAGACGVLKGMFSAVLCHGVRILVDGHDVLVDLPCSGSRMLVLLCILYAAMMALLRPRPLRVVVTGIVAVAAALAANTLRIAALAALVAHPAGGIDVMAEPWHDLTGLFFLALAALPLLLLTNNASPRLRRARKDEARPSARRPLFSAAFLALAAVIVALPPRPVDVAAAPAPVSLPVYIGGAYGTPVLLTSREKDYFLRYGGMAMKVAYGDASVMLVQTTSPLRHLHAPDDCLRGMGYDVEYAGMRYEPLPTAIYIASTPTGEKWRVAVTFYADRDHTANNVAEAVWRWMEHPGQTWHALQRITPLSLPDADARKWDDAVFAALDLTPRHPQEIAYATTH